MTKEELKEAIASTIVENGQKAITAESLANLLNEIVDAAGESGGGGTGGGGTGAGAVTVNVFEETPNETNAAAYETIINGLENLTCYPIMVIYVYLIVPVSVYLFDEEVGGILMILDLTAVFEQATYEAFVLHQDGSVENITIEE